MTGYIEERANLGGKVAAVLGGGGGIGRGVSMALAKAGVDLFICDIDAAALDQTVADAKALGRRVFAQVADATDPVALDHFYDEVGCAFDRLDIVVNVVGGTKRCKFTDMDRTMIARDIQRNYGYVIQSVQRAVPLIRKGARGGSIINFTTIEGHRGAATFAVYSGAKAATTNFTRAVAVELAAERIRLNCITPDTTPSQGNLNAMPPEDWEAIAAIPAEHQYKGIEMYVPMKVPPPVEALGDAVLFLASDLSAFITGLPLHVDGGAMAAAGFLDWPFGDGWVPCPMGGTIAKLYSSPPEQPDSRSIDTRVANSNRLAP